MRKLLIFCSAFFLTLTCLKLSAQENYNNSVQIGQAQLGVQVEVVAGEAFNRDSLLGKVQISCYTTSLFDTGAHMNVYQLERDSVNRNIYHTEIPVECQISSAMITYSFDNQALGYTPILLGQNEECQAGIYIQTDGNLFGTGFIYPDKRFPYYTTKDWMDINIITRKSMDMHFQDITRNYDGFYRKSWQEIRDIENEAMWKDYYSKVTSGIEVPDAASGWVVNNIRKCYATAMILPYVRNAELWDDLSVEEPPVAAYSFLDNIDYSPDIFLLASIPLPTGALLKEILGNPCKELGEIGEQSVTDWQAKVKKLLKPAIAEPNKLLLDLLSGMSYVNQIDSGTPLSETQIKNIQEGYTDDIGTIILARNEKMLSAKNAGSTNL